MSRIALMFLLTALLLGACGSTPEHRGRWNPNGATRNEDWHSPRAALLRFDANQDKILTRAELVAGLKAEFATYDSDHNNCISLDEVRAINQLRVQNDASQAMPLVDWNQDGCVDFREFSGATLSLFDSLDTDGDGKLAGTELYPEAHHPNGGRPGVDGPADHGREHSHGDRNRLQQRH